MNEDLFFKHQYFTIDMLTSGSLKVNIHINTDHNYDDLKALINYYLRNKYMHAMYKSGTIYDIVSYLTTTIDNYIKTNNIIIKDDKSNNPYISFMSNNEFNLNKTPVKDELDRTFNEKLYWNILQLFKVTDRHDTKMIANKFSTLYKNHTYIKNHRICKSDKDKSQSELYEYLYKTATRSQYDEHIYNPVTDTYYWVGFNCRI